MDSSIAALYCVYNDFLWLKYSLQSVYELMDRIYFLISDRPWYGSQQDNSRMLKVIADFPDTAGKFKIVNGSWGTEVDQRNASLIEAGVDGFKEVFIIDADEIYEPRELAAFIELARQKPEVGAWHVCMHTYWKSIRYRIAPPEPHAPPVFLRMGKVAYTETRNVVAEKHEICLPDTCLCHHMSYARPDEMMQRKHIWYPGHSQSMRSDWYEKKWKAWDKDHSIQDLHPVNPSHFKGTCEQSRHIMPSVVRHIEVLPEY